MSSGTPTVSIRQTAAQNRVPVSRDVALFAVFTLLGIIAANIHAEIPGTAVYFDIRWFFGIMGAVLIRRVWIALLLLCVLSVALPADTPLAVVFVGNMAYMVPTFAIIRLADRRFLSRIEHPALYGLAWFVLVMLCYQIFFTPILWGAVFLMQDKSFLGGMLEGWRTQPLLVESTLVALLAAAGLTAFRIHRQLHEQEQRFRSFIENANDIVYALAPDGTFTYVSPNWLEFMGEPAEEAIGKAFEPYVHPDDVHLCRDFLRKILATGEKQDSVEYRVRHRDGSWRWHVSNGAPLLNNENQAYGYVGIARDATRLKSIEEKLRESEELLDAAGRMARVGGWELDARTMEVTWTKATYDIHEIPSDTRPPLEDAINFFHPDDRPMLEQGLQDALEHGTPYDLELRFITAKGRHLITHTQCTPVWEDGKVIKLRGTFQDITELRRAEEELNAIFNMSLAIICVADINTATFTRVSPASSSILGYEPEELQSQCFFNLLHPDDVEKTQRVVEEFLARGEKVFSFVNRYRHKDGSYRWLMWNSHPRPELGLTYAIAIDITEQKKMQERLQQMEKMDAIGQLAGGVAHDFNNQLGGIMGYADLLDSRLEDPTLKRYVGGILASTRRASDLTQKLLAFAHKGQYQSIAVDMHAIIHEVVEILNHSIDKRIQIKQLLAASPPVTQGDPSQLQNALLNLAINAADAMPDGGELVFATDIEKLDTDYCAKIPYNIESGPYLCISISDTGCGIPRENLDRIFEPFFTTKGVGKGTGMGLAAVYGTVKHHGGAINLYSEPDHCTTFRVYLPASEKALEQMHAAPEVVQAPGDATILLVDDEDVIRDVAEEMLTHLGYRVISQPDGDAGLAYYEAHWRDVDLVILDMVMPKRNGSETYRAMHSINPEVKVLLASGYSINGAAQALLDEGVRGFLQKPFQRAELSTRVAAVLQE